MKRLRYIPSIDVLQAHAKFVALQKEGKVPKAVLTNWVKVIVETLRQQFLSGQFSYSIKKEADVYTYIFEQLQQKYEQFTSSNVLQPVINATGVVVHTNLGRSRLSKRALEQMSEVSESYSTLEYDIAAGKRGSRHAIVEQYLVELTNAEAALVVNNNAAAVYLVLKALAEDKEVIVSRGELIEIGGSFRISEIMRLSDATLVEVGTTNKTKLADYRQAITEETGLILKVHKSNFAMVGFTEEVGANELAQLAKEWHIPLYEDLGSGTLFNFKDEKIGSEPTVQEQVAKGIDIISFSGDKLLGGPQAGIIVGKKEYIERLKRYQLARVLRVDKFTLASLEATLKAYLLHEETAEIPTVRDILVSERVILERAKKFIEAVERKTDAWYFSIEASVSKVGGGTMPDVDLPTFVVQVSHPKFSSAEIAKKLRNFHTPIIVRVKNDYVQLDFRTVTDAELQLVIEAFHTLVGK